MIARTVTTFAVATLTHCVGRIDVCLSRLNRDQVWTRASDQENAVGNLVLHLCGNLRQYTRHGILGEEDIRTRDEEFNAVEGEELRERLRAAVRDAAAIIGDVTEARLSELVTIQNREISILEAILKTTTHFAEHTGQIVFATKLLTHQETGFSTHNKRGS